MKQYILNKNTAYTQQVERLLAEAATYDVSLLNRIPPGGGWSAAQVLLHLIEAEERSLQYLLKKAQPGATYEKPGFSHRWRGFLLWLSLVSPLKWKAPAGLTENFPQQVPLEELQTRWRAVREAFTSFFQQMPAEMSRLAVYKHPRAGKISWTDFFAFMRSHVARHTKQMRKALGQG